MQNSEKQHRLKGLRRSTCAGKANFSGISLTYLCHPKEQVSSLSLSSVVTEKDKHTQGFRQPHAVSRTEGTSA